MRNSTNKSFWDWLREKLGQLFVPTEQSSSTDSSLSDNNQNANLMSNTLIITTDKQSLFINNGKGNSIQKPLNTAGFLVSVVGDGLVNMDVSRKFESQIENLLTKDKVIVEFDITDKSKENIFTINYNQVSRSVAIIGVTDIEVNLADGDTHQEITGHNSKAFGVKFGKTNGNPWFISERVILARTEQTPLTVRPKNSPETASFQKMTTKLKFYFLEKE